jgi:hypothetical protein
MFAPIILEDGTVKLVDTASEEFAQSKAKVSTKTIKAGRGNMKEPAIDKRADKTDSADDFE